MEKATLIIDGGYIVKGSSFKIDYIKLKKEIQKSIKQEIGDSIYFNSKSQVKSSVQMKFFNFLKSAEPVGPRFEVILSELKYSEMICPACSEAYSKSVQKGVDVSIAIKMVEKAFLNKGSTTVLLAGDGDFEKAIEFVKNFLSQKVIIVGFKKTMSTDIQSIADQVIFLDDMKNKIEL